MHGWSERIQYRFYIKISKSTKEKPNIETLSTLLLLKIYTLLYRAMRSLFYSDESIHNYSCCFFFPRWEKLVIHCLHYHYTYTLRDGDTLHYIYSSPHIFFTFDACSSILTLFQHVLPIALSILTSSYFLDSIVDCSSILTSISFSLLFLPLLTFLISYLFHIPYASILATALLITSRKILPLLLLWTISCIRFLSA